MGSGTRPCRVLTVPRGVICEVTTEALLGVRMGHRLVLPASHWDAPTPHRACACPSVCLSGL